MSQPAPNAELLQSLSKLVRGLSALFWGLPSTLVICFHTYRAGSFQSFGVWPPLFCAGLLVYGLVQIGAFRKPERVWQNTLDLAKILSLVNLGLSPFLFWANKVPGQPFFATMVLLLMAAGLCFLASLNLVLQRLGAMLPDEALRQEIKQFTALNLNLLLATLVLGSVYLVLGKVSKLPLYFEAVRLVLENSSFWLLVLLVLLPLAMTMALLWKTKEVILESVFEAKA